MPDDATGPDSDWPRLAFLRTVIVNEAIKKGEPFDIVLQAGGQFISGKVVSFDRWADALVRSDPTREDGPTAVEDAEDAADPEQLQESEMLHIHLIDATVFRDGLGGDLTFAAWQVPLARIEGWTLGRMSRNERQGG